MSETTSSVLCDGFPPLDSLNNGFPPLAGKGQKSPHLHNYLDVILGANPNPHLHLLKCYKVLCYMPYCHALSSMLDFHDGLKRFQCRPDVHKCSSLILHFILVALTGSECPGVIYV